MSSLALAALLASALVASPVVIELGCDAAASSRAELHVRSATPARVVARTTRAAVLYVDEVGNDLVASGGEQVRVFELGTPLRHGRFVVLLPPGARMELALRQQTHRQSAATARASLECADPTPAFVAAISKLDEAARWAREPADLAALEPRLAALDAIERSGLSPDLRARVVHAKAQLLYRNDRTRAASEAFERAESAWLDAGLPSHATVARVGAIDELLRLGRHRELLARVATSPADSPYFALRLELAGCVAHRYLGDLSQSRACYVRVVDGFRALDEPRDVGSALVDLAELDRLRGDAAAAGLAAEAALLQASQRDDLQTQGRAALLLGDLALARADLAQANAAYLEALGAFESHGATRWKANALLRIGHLYLSLGALADAEAASDAALSLLSDEDAPARIAAARVLRARVAMEQADYPRARDLFEAAERDYVALEMPVELDLARIARARLALALQDDVEADGLLARHSRDRAGNHAGWKLVAASLAARAGRCAEMRTIVAPLPEALRTIEEHVELALAEARCLAGESGNAAAEQHLAAVRGRLVAVAGRVHSPALRLVLAARLLPLRRAAFAYVLDEATPRNRVAERAWFWLDAHHALTAGTSGGRATSDAGAAAALEIGVPDEQSARDARRLLRAFVAAGTATAAPATVEAASGDARLETARLSLPADATFLAHLDAGAAGYVLVVDRDRVAVRPAPSAAALRARSSTLNALLADRSSDVGEIAKLLRPLKQSIEPVLAEVAGRRLVVHAEGELAALPWALLRAIDRGETTSIAYSHGPSSASTLAANVDVVVPSHVAQPGGVELPHASREPGWIATILGDPARLSMIVPATGAAWIDAIARPGWLHLASHGMTDPGRIGISGIWLDGVGERPDARRFVTWLDIQHATVRREVIVLNACEQAGAGGLPRSPRFSFAHVLARRGATHVVGSAHPISDTAAAVWVPAFYRELVHGTKRVDRAVAAAQLALLRSRAFRHPFHWAGLVHVTQLGAAATTTR